MTDSKQHVIIQALDTIVSFSEAGPGKSQEHALALVDAVTAEFGDYAGELPDKERRREHLDMVGAAIEAGLLTPQIRPDASLLLHYVNKSGRTPVLVTPYGDDVTQSLFWEFKKSLLVSPANIHRVVEMNDPTAWRDLKERAFPDKDVFAVIGSDHTELEAAVITYHPEKSYRVLHHGIPGRSMGATNLPFEYITRYIRSHDMMHAVARRMRPEDEL